MTSPLKRLFGQTAIYGLSSILGRLLNYLLVPLYTAVFVDPSDYGVVSELYAWVAFLIVLLTFGMETAFFKFIQKEGSKEKTFATALVSLLFVNGIFFLVVVLFNKDLAYVWVKLSLSRAITLVLGCFKIACEYPPPPKVQSIKSPPC